MFPFSFEWAWDAGHLIFFGGLWYAISILGMGMTYVIFKSLYDMIWGEESEGH